MRKLFKVLCFLISFSNSFAAGVLELVPSYPSSRRLILENTLAAAWCYS